MFINVVCCLGCDRPSGHLFVPASLVTFYLCLSYFILAVPMRECMYGKTLVHEVPLSIAILKVLPFSLFTVGETKHARRTLFMV